MRTRFYIKTAIALIAISLLLILPACNKATVITGDQKDQILAYADPMADNVIQGLDTGDYATFSKNFTPEMIKGIPENSFQEMSNSFQTKLGGYQSKAVTSVEELQGNIAVIYTLAYTKAPKVTMRLVTTTSEPHQVAGLWFNAPELQ